MTEQNGHIDLDQLWAYLDGVLDPSQAEMIQAHLAECPLCQAEFDRLEKLTLRLENLPEVGLTKDLSGLVVSQLKAERALSPAITWTLVAEALAAGTVIGVLIPVIRAAGWLPRLQEIQLSLGAAVNVFLTQLASSWLVWWAGLKVQLNQLIISFNPLESLPLGALSPWTLIGTAGGLVILLNALLLRGHPLPNGNNKQIEV
ncbi:MAG: anti-sigma factor family protein [Anaerolineales bacterium]